MNVPNFFTLLRIMLVPVMMLFFYLPTTWGRLVSAGIFALAALTDWLDGLLARNLKQTSRLGAFLDPVADKLIVAVALILLVGEKELPYLSLPAAVIVGREIAISALREWMAELGKRATVAVSYVAKLKTAMQMLAVILLLAYRPGQFIIGAVGYVMLYLAAVLTLWSMIIYLKVAWPDLTFQQK